MSAVQQQLARASTPVRMVNLDGRGARQIVDSGKDVDEIPVAVCVASYQSSPITDVFVAQPSEAYPIEMTVRLPFRQQWAQRCYVAPVTTIGCGALTLPQHEFAASDSFPTAAGLCLPESAT